MERLKPILKILPFLWVGLCFEEILWVSVELQSYKLSKLEIRKNSRLSKICAWAAWSWYLDKEIILKSLTDNNFAERLTILQEDLKLTERILPSQEFDRILKIGIGVFQKFVTGLEIVYIYNQNQSILRSTSKILLSLCMTISLQMILKSRLNRLL